MGTNVLAIDVVIATSRSFVRIVERNVTKMFWGITPALDLQAQYLGQFEHRDQLNVLIIGSEDARHILMTLSQRYKHRAVTLNFYVVDLCLELVARQLLMLNFAFEDQSYLSLSSKARAFMDIYGNALVRPTVARYLTAKSAQMVRMVTDPDYCKRAMPFVTLHHLKYKERDYLENVFKYWCSDEPFCVRELWDRRVRQHLGVRYDSRAGVFDWDLHMRLRDAGAGQICPQEYKHWRGTGVAFTWLESEVSKANRTLVGGVVPCGRGFYHHGYLGDIVSGPFIAYGLHCENKELLKTQNGVNSKRATDITEYNLMRMFHELEHQEVYEPEVGAAPDLGALVAELNEQRVVDELAEDVTERVESSVECREVRDALVHFASHTWLDLLPRRKNFRGQFDVIYYSGSHRGQLSAALVEAVAAARSLLIVENQRYVPSSRNEQLQAAADDTRDKLRPVAGVTELPFRPHADDFALFTLRRTNQQNKD